MRVLARRYVVALALPLLLSGAVNAAEAPCIQVETQDWWTPTAGAPDPSQPSHGHAAWCVPTGPVSGLVDVELRVVWHNNAGTITRFKWQDDLNYQIVHNVSLTPPLDQPFTHTITVDTAKIANSGWRLFRTYVYITQPDGNTQIVRGIYPVFVSNGKARKDANSTWIKPTGWYKDATLETGYVNAAFKRISVPTAAVSGSFSLGINCTTNGGAAPSRTEVFLDPDFHNGSSGTLLLSQAGGYSGNVSIPDLPAGSHRIVQVCTQNFSAGRVHAGVGSLTIEAN